MSTSKNTVNPTSRKRLLQKTSAALPPTATRMMLEAILDSKPAQKKKKLATPTTTSTSHAPAAATNSCLAKASGSASTACATAPTNSNSMWSHVVRQAKPNSYRMLPANSSKSDNNISKHALSSKPSLLSAAPHFKHKKIANKGTNNTNIKTCSTSNTKTTSTNSFSVARTNPSTATRALLDRTTGEENQYPTSSTSRNFSPTNEEPRHRLREVLAAAVTTTITTATTAPSSPVSLGTAITTASVITADNAIANTIAPPSISVQHPPSQGKNTDDSARGNPPAASQGRSGTSLVAPLSSVSSSLLSSSSLRIGLKLKGGGVADARKNQVSRSRLPPRPLPPRPHHDESNTDVSTLQNVEQYMCQSIVPTKNTLPHTSSFVTTSNHNESQPPKETNTTTTNSLGLFGFPLSSSSANKLSFASSLSTTTSTTTNEKGLLSKQRPSLHNHNDNFVRQNLRNSAGACRGARNKKRMRKKNPWNDNKYGFKGETDDREDSNDEEGAVTNGPRNGWSKNTKFRKNGAAKTMGGGKDNSTLPTSSRLTGLDPLDDYLDGMFQPTKKTPPTAPGRAAIKGVAGTGGGTLEGQIQQPQGGGEGDVPKCPRHQKLCKCLKVKKASTGNKGRKFYVCSMPRGEQCDFFQWDDDTVQAARMALQKNTSQSGFIARQVAAHFDRFKLLTVPELREEASRRKLNKSGKRQQLLTRLAIWVRDELVNTPFCADKGEETNDSIDAKGNIPNDSCPSSDEEAEGEDSSEDDSDSDSSASDDLEICMDEELSSSFVKAHGSSTASSSSKGSETRDDKVQSTLRELFGHDNFRDGQEWAINRCLDHKRTLLVAPTGFGKSLCYALPAALMDGVCVVVSPLISLIQDQLRSLPPSVPAATLSGSLSAAATAAIVDDVIRNRIKILFVSPERFASASFRRLFRPKWNPDTRTKERPFPDISLLCIDEAHCASHWAHNFRPCFLRFKHLLALASPKSVLAITATAGPRVIADISNTLSIQHIETGEDGNANEESLENIDGIRVLKTNRDNIDVSCLMLNNHEERLALLAKILKPRSDKSPRDKDERIAAYAGSLSKGSVIVYVWRQCDTEIVAENLNASGVTGGVVVYHGGMDSGSRSRAQSKFMRGRARICVATVAFGLGIDKSDVEGIVHMYLSSSPEHYLQEIGRAGRDGRQAKAISLPLMEEVPVRHSLVHSDAICKSQAKVLLLTLRQLVRKATSGASDKHCPQGAVHIAVPLEPAVIGCDCKPETIETILSLIEQNDGLFLHVEGVIYDRATIALKKRTLEKLAEKEQVAACIKECGSRLDRPSGEADPPAVDTTKAPSNFQSQFLAYSFGSYAFSVASCSNKLGPLAEPRNVFASLRRLQTSNELEFVLDTSPVGRALHVQILGKAIDMFCSPNSDERIDELANSLVQRFSSAVSSSATKVLDMHYIMHEVASASSLKPVNTSELGSKSKALERFQELVHSYFEGEGLLEERSVKQSLLPDSFSKIPDKRVLVEIITAIGNDLALLGTKHKTVCADVIALKLTDPEVSDYVSLSIAKFLHGLETPRASSKAFRSHPLFGKWRELNFELVLKSVEDVVNNPSLHS